jgi:hypothetical protein
LLGNSGTPIRGPVVYWYLLIGGKAHWHNNLRGSANRLHPRERVYIIRD